MKRNKKRNRKRTRQRKARVLPSFDACERRRIGERIVAIFVVVACEERDGGRLHTHPA